MELLSSIFTLSTAQTALELGCVYALVALALFLSYSILNIADLSTDGCFTLGCAVCCQVTLMGHPFLGLLAAMAAGVLSGYITAFLQTRLGVESILAGIIVNTGLYTINLMAMGFSSTLSVFKCDTIFSLAKSALSGVLGGALAGWSKLLVAAVIALTVALLLTWFLKTRLGLSIRATGDSPDMIRASSVNPAFTITVGLCLANSLTGLAGCLIGQLNKSCDINLGTGMVTVALASLVIGESLMGRGSIARRVFGVVLGAVLYRLIIAVAISTKIVPTEGFKLVSALIVAVAIATPYGRKMVALQKQKLAAKKKREGAKVC